MAQPIAVDQLATSVYPYLLLSDTNLRMVKGDTFALALVLTTNGTAFNLTSCSIRFTAKYAISDPDASFAIQKTVGSGIVINTPASGLFTVTLSPSDTRNLANGPTPDSITPLDLFYDIQVTDASSNIYTVMIGTLTIRPDVSITSP